jgi:hypothetical protein
MVPRVEPTPLFSALVGGYRQQPRRKKSGRYGKEHGHDSRSSDDRHVIQTGFIQGLPRLYDERRPFLVGEVMSFTHRSGDDGEHADLCETDEVGGEGWDVWWVAPWVRWREVWSGITGKKKKKR